MRDAESEGESRSHDYRGPHIEMQRTKESQEWLSRWASQSILLSQQMLTSHSWLNSTLYLFMQDTWTNCINLLYTTFISLLLHILQHN